MNRSLNVAVAALAALLPIANPLGAMAAFSGLTGGFDRAEARRQAIKTGIYVFAILGVFALLGPAILSAFGISLPALQIAGGLVVCHSGFRMIVPTEALSQHEQDHAATKEDVSFSPMALPLVAGPGAIGVVIALGSRHPDLFDRLGIVAATAILGALVGLALVVGSPLVNRLGKSGVGALTRIMGFLILAIGVELIVHGVLAVRG